MEESSGIFKIVIGKNTGRRTLGRPRRRREGNIRMGLKEIVVNTINCINSAQDREYWTVLVNAALNFWFP